MNQNDIGVSSRRNIDGILTESKERWKRGPVSGNGVKRGGGRWWVILVEYPIGIWQRGNGEQLKTLGCKWKLRRACIEAVVEPMDAHYLQLEDSIHADRQMTKDEPWGRLLGSRREWDLARKELGERIHTQEQSWQPKSEQPRWLSIVPRSRWFWEWWHSLLSALSYCTYFYFSDMSAQAVVLLNANTGSPNV